LAARRILRLHARGGWRCLVQRMVSFSAGCGLILA
jgi:hypothetical protein